MSLPRHLACVTLMLLLTAFGCKPASEVASGPKPQPVDVAHPEVQPLAEEDDYTGTMAASETVDVRARVRGHIFKVAFKDGDMVKKGQLLFELDPRPFEAAVAEAQAQWRAVDAQRYAAERDVARYVELVKSRAASQAEYEKVAADAQSYARQADAKAQEVRTRELDLEYSKIKAEISGRIGRALLTVGNLVNAGGSDPVLANIQSIDPIYVYFTIDERSLQRYQKQGANDGDDGKSTSLRDKKMPFWFKLDSDKGFPRQGVLDFANNEVDRTTGTILVRGVLENQQYVYLPGMRVRVRIRVGEPKATLLVPDTAVNTDQDQKYLLVVDTQAENVVKRYNVVLGRLLDNGMRAIVSAEPALSERNWVIVQGMQSARLNRPCKPIYPNATPAANP